MLTAARQGDPLACSRIWSTYAPMVTGFARARGSREPDDLVSEVFLGLFRGLASFDGDEPAFRGYLFTLARRRLVDEHRAAARRPVTTEWADGDGDRPTASAEEEVLAAAGHRDLVALLDELSPDQRDVLTLRLVADLTVEQVAATLGKNPGAVKALQHRALATLRRRMTAHRPPATAATTAKEPSA